MLDVACGLSFDDMCLAQSSQILHTASFLWNLPHHVWKHFQDHGKTLIAHSHLCRCLWTWISHFIHQQCKFKEEYELFKIFILFRQHLMALASAWSKPLS